MISLGRITPTLISGAAKIDPPRCRGCLGLEGWMGDRQTGVPKVLPQMRTSGADGVSLEGAHSLVPQV
jgi:hypothetical protein